MPDKRKKNLGVDVILNNVQGNPFCTHGPTILFEKYFEDGSSRQFYACSACRDRKSCPFFHWTDERISATKEQQWMHLYETTNQNIDRQGLIGRVETMRTLEEGERMYCHTCASLLHLDQSQDEHEECVTISPVTDHHLDHPSTLFPPKDNAKFEAQYLFGKQSIDMLLKLVKDCGMDKVLCIGAPRIHEALRSKSDLGIATLMLDIDDRYCSFFSAEKFVLFNLFNKHFFEGPSAESTYKKFITGAHRLMIVCDPPFGGRMELIAHTFQSIEEDWKSFNNLAPTKKLPVILAFPYFLESQILSTLPSYSMLDYQVDYDNHPLYSSGDQGMRNGSAVRFFVNLPTNMFVLPKEDGYHLCKPCDRYVHKNNNHCNKCDGCMSKDGRTYKHCDSCSRCVKPSWQHCDQCKQCRPGGHKCSSNFDTSVVGHTCHICGQSGHKRTHCPNKKRTMLNHSTFPPKKKVRKKNLPSTYKEETSRNLAIMSDVLKSLSNKN